MSHSKTAYRIQFQKGLGLREFLARYGTEDQCRQAVFTSRYPEGFLCRFCGCKKYWIVARPALKCACCRTETSLTAGTLFHSTKLPLTTWFLGIYLFTQTKTGMSSVELKRHLGVNVKTASLIQHKLMETFFRHERRRRLAGTVRIIQAKLPRGTAPTRDTATAASCRFLVAAEVGDSGGLVHACVDAMPTLRRAELRHWIAGRVVSGSRLDSGLKQFSVGAKLQHRPDANIRNPVDCKSPIPSQDWGRILSGNLCTALEGVRHRSFHRYRARYLGLFQFRLNHRFDLAGIAEIAIRLSALSSERPRSILMQVESDGQSRTGKAHKPPVKEASGRSRTRRPAVRQPGP